VKIGRGNNQATAIVENLRSGNQERESEKLIIKPTAIVENLRSDNQDNCSIRDRNKPT
jgi:hypothetical protein